VRLPKTNRQEFFQRRIDALEKERERLLAKGIPPNAPRVMKLVNLIRKAYRDMGQLPLFGR
jgi:hypothetical protein